MKGKYVFISYKVEEYTQAKAVKDHLEKNGVPCWMAPMSIRGGLSYAQEIPPAIRDSSVFLLILSARAQESKWVPRELDQAINCGKLIMPFMLENCPLRNDFSFYLTNVQRYEAFRDPDETLSRMTRDIQNALGIIPPPKEAPPKEEPPREAPRKEPQREPVRKAPPKPPRKESKPVAAKKKKLLPWLLVGGAVLFLTIVLPVILGMSGSVKIGGVTVKKDAYLVQLENVTLTQSDVDRFSKLPELGSIRLTNCNIEAKNLKPMSGEELSFLELEQCGITNAQLETIDFSGMWYFRELDVSGNPQLTSLGGLQSCAGTLKLLDISDTGIQSFDWLSAFDGLRSLRADRTGLQDTGLLEKMVYLEELSLSGNGISDLTGLGNTSKLEVVDLSHNELTDVSVLGRSAACLEEIYLNHNHLSNLDFLSEAHGLQVVYVDENELTMVDWLKDKQALQILSASNNRIVGITGLGIGAQMRYLNLSHNLLQTVEEGDLVFGEDSFLMVDLSSNRLQILQLPQNCTYKDLALMENPDLDLSQLKGVKGWNVYFELPDGIELQTLKEMEFYHPCIVNCPLDRKVEMEEAFSDGKLMTKEEALAQIAQRAKEAQ